MKPFIIQTLRLSASIMLFIFMSCSKENPITSIANEENASTELGTPLTARSVSQDFYDISYKINNCIETILIQGRVHIMYNDFRVTPGGHFTFSSHYNSKGTGFAYKSGNQYEWINIGKKEYSGNLENGAYHATYAIKSKLVGKGSVPDTEMLYTYTLRINANGEITLDNMKVTSTCD